VGGANSPHMDRSCAKRGRLLPDAGLGLRQVLPALQREVAGRQVAGRLRLQRRLLAKQDMADRVVHSAGDALTDDLGE
ncbi:MAG TPA: hypothetical protein VGS60_12850, partial [Actinomycetes bacterium]|nr:hypothetical protein [Actinomycetes bacterium]